MAAYIVGFILGVIFILSAALKVDIDKDKIIKEGKPILIEEKVYRCLEVKLATLETKLDEIMKEK